MFSLANSLGIVWTWKRVAWESWRATGEDVSLVGVGHCFHSPRPRLFFAQWLRSRTQWAAISSTVLHASHNAHLTLKRDEQGQNMADTMLARTEIAAPWIRWREGCVLRQREARWGAKFNLTPEKKMHWISLKTIKTLENDLFLFSQTHHYLNKDSCLPLKQSFLQTTSRNCLSQHLDAITIVCMGVCTRAVEMGVLHFVVLVIDGAL